MLKQQHAVELQVERLAPPAPAGLGSTDQKARDHLANERTFLAWVRTALALITFGLLFQRLGHQPTVLLTLHLKAHTIDLTGRLLCAGSILLGLIFLPIALLNFLRTYRDIECLCFRPRTMFAVLLTTITLLIGSLLFLALMTGS
jgi:putative membrane protein